MPGWDGNVISKEEVIWRIRKQAGKLEREARVRTYMC